MYMVVCFVIMNYEQKGFHVKHLDSVILVMVLPPKQKKNVPNWNLKLLNT